MLLLWSNNNVVDLSSDFLLTAIEFLTVLKSGNGNVTPNIVLFDSRGVELTLAIIY
jgi:hypothetical protein